MTTEHPSLPRIDKYLWATRIFKTRGDAAEACRNKRVSINGQEAKPSREVKASDVIVVRKGPVRYTYKVLALLTQRVAAKNLPTYILDVTSPEELSKGEQHNEMARIWRTPGTGRPTKKDRRLMERVMDT